MQRQVNIALTLSHVINGDITRSGIEILDLRIVKLIKNGAIVVDHKDKTFYIVFRGTEDLSDVLSDIQYIQSKTNIDDKECYVHSGFLKEYESVKDDILNTPFGAYDIVVCGHSLGGAIAIICGADLQATNTRKVITFGSPRVGDKKFKKIYDESVTESLRFVHNNDIVPIINIINYTHVKGEIRLSDDGKVIGNYNFWKRFIYWIKGKGGFLSIEDHFMIKYMSVVGKWNSNS